MKLKPFDMRVEEKKLNEAVSRREIILLAVAFCFVILLLIKNSFAVFRVSDSLNFIDTSVGEFNSSIKKTIIDGEIHIDYDDNMIPVAYNGNGETVKADINSKTSPYAWFNYEEYKWANVVLVKQNGINNREDYKTASPGAIVEEDDILAYLVYIPRYRYLLFNVDFYELAPNQIEAINIEFENKEAGKSIGTSNGSWLTHPAFTFGDTELNGIWVGKFETTGTATNPAIKPNISSLRNQTVSEQFTSSLLFKSEGSYGISSFAIDSHMMKNLEWGAVSYLSQSQYGIRGNLGVEISINNSTGYVTGRSAGAPGGDDVPEFQEFFPGLATTKVKYGRAGYYAWDDKKVICKNVGACHDFDISIGNFILGERELGKGTSASTTGTQYGIYDMSGGSYENVMGNMAEAGETIPGAISSGNSGFDGITYPYPTSKYYDSYSYGSTSSHTRSHIGDAMGETRGWYGDNINIVYLNEMWVNRGAYARGGVLAGIFCYSRNTGIATSNDSWRLSIVIK